MPQFPSVTKTFHHKPYPAIDPSRPKLAAKGKVVAITGGAGTIGRATALAFAKAGATKIAVLGLADDNLSETKKVVEDAVSGVEVFTCKGNLLEADSLRGAFGNVKQELGEIDILVANAAFLPKVETLHDADPEEWWKGFEVNTKGAFHCCRAFLPVAAPNAVLVDISSGRVHLPALPTSSGYMASKLAATKIYETFGVENPQISVVHIHPGVVDSDLFRKTGQDTSFDDENLAGQFVVWAVSAEAKPLRGKYLWCNWDVEELKQEMDALSKPDQLSITLNGWPFGTGGGNALKN